MCRSTGLPFSIDSSRPLAWAPGVWFPLGEHLDELGVQRDVAVVVELADRDPQPVGVPDADHGVDLQGAELTDAHPGAGQEFDGQTGDHPLL
jgi:hypothetical protein